MTARATNQERFAEFCATTGRDARIYQEQVLGGKDEPKRAHCVSLFQPAQGSSFVVKTIARPIDDGAFNKRLRNHRLAFNSGASVPRVFWVFEDSRTVVMEHVVGITAAKGLAREPLKTMRRVGTWAGDFHRRSGPREQAFQARFMIAHIDRLMDEARAGKRRIPGLRQFAARFDGLAQFGDLADGASVVSTANHGDLNPKNLMLGEKRVCGLDFAEFNTAPAPYDLARFLVAAQGVMNGRGWDTDCVIDRPALDAFLLGYSEVSWDDPVLQFLLRARLLIDWAAIHDSPMSFAKWRRLRALQRGARLVM